MRTKAYFIFGDILANLAVGILTAWACIALIDPHWYRLVAMLIGMGVGMLVAGLLGGLLFFRYFGALEMMLPTMLTGMLAGMAAGMGAAMGHAPAHNLLLGAGMGLLVWAFMIWLNRRLSGVQPLTE